MLFENSGFFDWLLFFRLQRNEVNVLSFTKSSWNCRKNNYKTTRFVRKIKKKKKKKLSEFFPISALFIAKILAGCAENIA